MPNNDPNITTLYVRITHEEFVQIKQMAKESGFASASLLARSLIREILADDREAHAVDQHEVAA